MADSKFDICNKAMVLVGANTISSFTENTTESKVARSTLRINIRKFNHKM